MKGLLVLALCAAVATALELRGSITNLNELLVIQPKFPFYGDMKLSYSIKFPKASVMVHLIMMDAFEANPMPTTCGEEGNHWKMTFSENSETCKASPYHHEIYGDMIECRGSTYIQDPSNSMADKFFLLARCEERGLWGTSYELMDYDIPYTASGVSALPSIALLSLASLLAYFRLL